MNTFYKNPIYKNSLYKNIFYIIITVATLLAMLADTAGSLSTAQAALDGWWSRVLPALLPFFIISEVCTQTGLIRTLGVWLSPIMQPLFHLPGAAAVAILLGFFSGAPTGAAVTANLYQSGLITRNQGNRMLAFCNNTSPLYLLITVSALLGDATIGVLLAAVQYPINLAFGLLLRFAAQRDETAVNVTMPPAMSPLALFLRGWQELALAPAPAPAVLLKNAALKALTTIGMIGAFMLTFSLIIHAVKFFGVDRLLFGALSPLVLLLGLPAQVLPALSDGLFEMTLGLSTLSQADISLFDRLLAAAIILGWSGLSIHIQVAGVCSGTDLSLGYYLPCRALHSILAPLILLIAQEHISINSSTLPTASWPLWLSAPGVMLAPVVLLLVALILFAFGQSLTLWLLHRR